MRNRLSLLVLGGMLINGITQAQIVDTGDQPQIMGMEGSNPPVLQLPSNPPPAGSNAGTGVGQGGNTIQGINSPPAIKLSPQTPTLKTDKAQTTQDTGKIIKKGAVKLETQGPENEPGLKAGTKGLNNMRSPGSLLGNSLGVMPPSTQQPFGAPGIGFKSGAKGVNPNPGGIGGPTSAKTKGVPKLPGDSGPGGLGKSVNKKSPGFGSATIKMGSLPPLPPLNTDDDEAEGTGTAAGNTGDVVETNDGNTNPDTGLPIDDSYENDKPHKEDTTSTDPKDRKDVKDLKDTISNTGNPNDPGDGSVEIDQEKITAVKKAIQKRKCAGSDTRTTGSENCVQEVPTQAKTQQRVCKKRSEIGGRCEQWGPVPTGPIVDYNKAQPDNVRPD